MSGEEGEIGRKFGKVCLSWVPAMLATGAFICSMLFGFWCESIKFQALDRSPAGGRRDDLHFGPWYQLEITIEHIGVGDKTRIVTRKNCIDWQHDPTIDSKWKTVKAFTIISAILGGFLTIPLWFTPCLAGRISENTWRAVAIAFTVVLTLFQGLTFLIFKSNACNSNAAVNNIHESLNLLFYEEECDWDSGSTANVIAVICWFLTGIFMLFTGPPQPPERAPPQTQTVTYQQEINEDGTQTVTETKVVKGEAIPAPEQEDALPVPSEKR